MPWHAKYSRAGGGGGLDYSLFIYDKEMTGLLKGYDNLKDEDKSTIKKIIRAFIFYSKVQETQKGMAV